MVGKVNAAKMVRRSAETKKEGVTSEEPADGYGGTKHGSLKRFLWADVMSAFLDFGMVQV